MELKRKKETQTELAHIEVWHNNNYVGYLIKNESKPKEWVFCSKSELPYLYGKKLQLIEDLKKLLV
jgi:hypothetical protein